MGIATNDNDIGHSNDEVMLHNRPLASVHGISVTATLQRRGDTFVRPHRTAAGLLVMVMAACLSVPLHAQSSSFDGVVALSSQLVDRGVAITPATPILQGAAAWTTASGWSLGLSGSTEVRSPGHLVEALAQGSRSWSLSDDWQMQANLLYYSYPSSARSRAYDRAELGVGWIYRDILTFNLSAAHAFRTGSHRPRAAADLSLHWPLAWHFSLSAGAGIAEALVAPVSYRGYTRTSEYDYRGSNHYAYGHAGLLWVDGRWQLELDRIATDTDMRHQRGDLRASPWVATIFRSF
ncbi:MAG TPA: hypothetical protein VGC19_03555 [Rhodanobacter sp.]